MTHEGLICVLLGIVACLMALMVFVALGHGGCFEVHGVDHNGKNEPFTIFLGFC